ncbi:unnamed protein product [Leptidea sinapis]|uniref:N-terminal acetyltransferase B complex subunit MDM20 homolog n=1 Tax=Leptidea sinapis TaxID=189913 RepID=A0A5E4QJP8_9NEOP|nr:unnamed protein product [Leptidea sinapis]
MAVQPLRAYDGGIIERRLRPIYDWLDNGNNKTALQEAEKVLRKTPSLQAARALKALALLRLGKTKQCFAILDDLVKEIPSDDITLQAMTISFRESHQLHKVCEIYEAAVKVAQSEDLYTHMFMSYVRIGDHCSQTRTAMALYKLTPKNPYYFWAVMSNVLQAQTAVDSTKKGILLTLAQRMVENFIEEKKMEAEQEARLYIMILKMQEKWEKILDFIESPLYEKLVPGSRAQACIPYLIQLGQWRRLNLLCKDLLWDNQDRWDYYMPYFDSVFNLKDNPDIDIDSNVDDTPEKCHEFICSIIESLPSGRPLRGPYLARLELWKRLSKDGDPTSLLGSGLALCVQYLTVFANKMCAIPDLKPYLCILPQSEREEHCRDFLTCLGLDENSKVESPSDIQRHCNCLSAWRLTAPIGSAEEDLKIATILKDHYIRCVADCLVTSTPTEFCAADTYAILAAHHFYAAAVQDKNPLHILEALHILELVTNRSPSNFHAKLLLISLYNFLGITEAAEWIYDKMDVKHIQLVSLGWLHVARLAPGLWLQRALKRVTAACSFHEHHDRDSVEQVTYAYKFGTFEKVVEVRAWSARIQACAWAALCKRERALLSLVVNPWLQQEQLLPPPHPLPEQPTDNRDLNAIVNWLPTGNTEQQKNNSFQQDVAYLRLKDGLLSCLVLCKECADSKSLEEKSNRLKELRSCVDAFGDALDKCRELCTDEPLSVAAPLPSRLLALVRSPISYRELYSSAVLMLGEVCAGSEPEAAVDRLRSALTASRSQLQERAQPQLWENRDALEFYANYLECIGVITYLLGMCHTPDLKKSKKKEKRSPEQIRTIIEALRQLNDELQETITTLIQIFENWPRFGDLAGSRTFTTNCFSGSFNSAVCSKIKQGIVGVMRDTVTILEKKIEYLKSLPASSQVSHQV